MTPTEQEGGKPMTNYNERLDEIVDTLDQFAPDQLVEEMRAQAKQAITSLIKELVAEAMPEPSTKSYFL